MKKALLILVLVFGMLTPMRIHANTPTSAITGNTQVTAGTRFVLTFAINNATNLAGIETIIAFNSNHFAIVDHDFHFDGGNNNPTTNRFTIDLTPNNRSGNVAFLRIEFQARPGFSVGTTSTIAMTNTFITQGITETALPNRQITLTSIAPLSTVNTLSAITINGNNLANFSPNTLSYTLNNTQATSITINATRTDNRSTLSGTGTFPLNFGNNRFALQVRSESGAVRTYTINVNRPDLRGDDTRISEVRIQDKILQWDHSTGRNILLVPYAVDVANLDIRLMEATSRVTSPLTHNLIVGENTLEISVQSERGTVQTVSLMVVRANEQGVFPPQYTSPAVNNVVLDDVVYLIQGGKVSVPFHVETPTIVFMADSNLTLVEVEGPDTLVFGDNVFSVTSTAFDGSTLTQQVTIVREDHMDPVSLSDLIANLESLPVSTLSFYYEGLITDEAVLNALVQTQKSLRVFVATESVTGYWTLNQDEIMLLRDLNFNLSELTGAEHYSALDYIIHSSVVFQETNFVAPIPFTFVELSGLSQFETLYGYAKGSEGLVLIDTWAVRPLPSTILVGGPLQVVITPVNIVPEVIEPVFDMRILYVTLGFTGLGWILWIIFWVRYRRLKKKFKNLKKGVI